MGPHWPAWPPFSEFSCHCFFAACCVPAAPLLLQSRPFPGGFCFRCGALVVLRGACYACTGCTYTALHAAAAAGCVVVGLGEPLSVPLMKTFRRVCACTFSGVEENSTSPFAAAWLVCVRQQGELEPAAAAASASCSSCGRKVLQHCC